MASGQYQWVTYADANGAATDTQLVENLVAGETYCFAVRSRNQDGLLISAFSNEVCPTTTPSSDTMPPAVSISTTPVGPTYTSAQTVTVSASASDNVGVTRVEFYDSTTLRGTDTIAPYSYAWAISNADNGSHSWTARAYDAAGNVTTSSALIRTVDIVVLPSDPPTADFTVSAQSGTAPFTATFYDSSLGEVTAWSWNFGDGGASTAQNPQHTYGEPGIYTVSLTASGPDGTDSEIKLDYIDVSTSDGGDNLQYPQLEVGEMDIDYQWQWIAFETPFGEPPIVVAKPLSAYDDTPATVRIRNVTQDGFEIRVQEWDYLNDTHGYETVSYLAMEPGSWELDNGARIEANRLDTDATTFFKPVDFAQSFGIAPVVLAAVTTENGTDAVVTRLRRIDVDQFEVRMYEQEGNLASHSVETISYIAWEPSSGTLDGMPFEVGATPNAVKQLPYAIYYQSAFAAPPMFLADMQTTNGGDVANLRWRNNSTSSVEVWVQEEQSADREVYHTTEVVGYLSFGQ